MPAILMKQISKAFDKLKALDHVDFEVDAGEVHCLLGENGAGKSTLMNILYGLYHADAGEIYIHGKAVHIANPKIAQQYHIGMVHQHFMLIESMTVLQNIILGNEAGRFTIDYAKNRSRIDELEKLYHFDFDLDTPISALSVGEKQRVEIFKALYRGADIVILDEPTAVLTPQEVDVLFRILDDMRKQGKTIIFITHKLHETMVLSDRVTVLRNGKIIGSLRTEEVTPKILATMMVGYAIDFDIVKSTFKPGKPVLELRQLKVLAASHATISLQVRQGEIYGIAGVDGNGQQELEGILAGTAKPLSGRIIFNGEDITAMPAAKRKAKGIALIPSDRLQNAILPGMPIIDNYLLGFQHNSMFSHFGILRFNVLKKHADNMVNQYSIKIFALEQPISQLSGGNQQKIVFSREAGLNPLLLVAVQPVRGLDIGAIDAIHRQLLQLRDRGKAILLISTELSEIMEMSDTIGVLYKGELIAQRKAGEVTIEQLGLFMAGERPE
ncbi:MAG: ABC transporter ATP-binding protein [Rectinema subterraneum]